jgi:hypothetical protein
MSLIGGLVGCALAAWFEPRRSRNVGGRAVIPGRAVCLRLGPADRFVIDCGRAGPGVAAGGASRDLFRAVEDRIVWDIVMKLIL